jgi:hypothetical protein
MSLIRLAIGLIGLLFITFMTVTFGIGGFFFTLGLVAVIIFASKKS